MQKPERKQASYLVKLKLKLLQYSGHLMRRADSLEKTLELGKTEGRKRRGWQRMRWLDDITVSKDMSLSKLLALVKELVVSDSLRPHEPQHARPPCPSQTPRVHPNPCPSSQ